MRIQKKIVRSFLALLPLLGVLLMFVTSFNVGVSSYSLHSRVRVTDAGCDVYMVFDEPNAMNAKLLGSMFSADYNLTDVAPSVAPDVVGALVPMVRFAVNLYGVTGIPLTYILISLWYAFYLFVVEMLFMVMEIITFIPRKCGEFFGG